jgi:hypothetical protein
MSWTDAWYLRAGLVVGALALLRFVVPVIAILLIPITFVLALPLDLLFPLKRDDR